MKLYTLIVALTLIASSYACAEGFKRPTVEVEAQQSDRDIAVIEKLKKPSNTIALYAQGLCCQSCAIGIRKTVGKLDFIDRERYNKGIELDSKFQLVTVAVKDNLFISDISRQAVAKAIDDAGYKPMHFYSVIDGKVHTEVLSHDKTQP